MDHRRAEQLAEIHGTPLLVFSKRRLKAGYRELKAALPDVELYFAVKAGAAPEIIGILNAEGACFDLASSGEIELVRSRDIPPRRCIHTHPIKSPEEIRYAVDFGIDLFVVDNEFELEKLIPYADKVRLLVRMSIENPACVVNLSHKFGAKPSETYGLIHKAHTMGFSVAGISFHVGSQSQNPLKHIEALEICRDICRKAALAGIPLEVIDIGGGFPINYTTSVPPLSEFCAPINDYLERYFANYRVIAEPGRVICGPAATLAARIIGKSLRDGVWWYYLDDGLYGSFSGKMYDHADYPMLLPRTGEKFTSTIAGPTCDSIDVLYEKVGLPQLSIGDILLFNAMGAYTFASATSFNGLKKATIIVVE